MTAVADDSAASTVARAVPHREVWLVVYQGVAVVAALKVLAGLLAVFRARHLPSAPIPPVVFVLHTVAFAVAGAYLIAGGRRDRRAVLLGDFLLLIASSFANVLLQRSDPPFGFARALMVVTIDAFLPLSLWLFVRHFPEVRRFDVSATIEAAAVKTAAAVGLICFIANVVLSAASVFSILAPRWLALLQRAPRGTLYWPLLFATAAPALPFAVWKSLRARPTERRRFAVFSAGIAIGFLPMAFAVIAEAASPRVAAYMRAGSHRAIGGLVLYPLLLSIPVTTAYAVAVRSVLSVRIIVRRALGYLLARATIVAAAAVPALLALASAVSRRSEPLQSVLVGEGRLSVLTPALIAVVMLVVRRPVLHEIDRRYFRERVDAETLLRHLTAGAAIPHSVREECDMVASEISRALHLTNAAVIVPDRAGQFVAPNGALRRIASTSVIVAAVDESDRWIEVDFSTHGLRQATSDDRQWIADAGAEVLVPLRGASGLVGVLILGSRLSELPHTREELTLVDALASTIATRLENLQLREASSGAPAAGPGEIPVAAVCASCGKVSADSAACGFCGGALAPAALPCTLAGKFRLDRQIGRGGMGVVFAAIDATLHRTVAIKTLPRISSAECERLRREGRSMAACVHPHLASIFSIETWRGTPALVIEYLEGGTLRDRLRRGRLPVLEAVRIGASVSDALAALHDAGLLHRDVKPSNIGFTARGTAKLLDFGLVDLLSGTATSIETPPRAVDEEWSTIPSLRGFAGTPAYSAPEALAGKRLDGKADVWSLGVVLFEAMSGVRPHGTTANALDRSPELRQYVPGCTDELALLVSQMLSPDRRRRPSAGEAHRALVEMSAETSAFAAQGG